jgi:hypothetical protein
VSQWLIFPIPEVVAFNKGAFMKKPAKKSRARKRSTRSSQTSAATDIYHGDAEGTRQGVEESASEDADIEGTVHFESDVERQGGIPDETPATPMFQEGSDKRVEGL